MTKKEKASYMAKLVKDFEGSGKSQKAFALSPSANDKIYWGDFRKPFF